MIDWTRSQGLEVEYRLSRKYAETFAVVDRQAGEARSLHHLPQTLGRPGLALIGRVAQVVHISTGVRPGAAPEQHGGDLTDCLDLGGQLLLGHWRARVTRQP